MAARTKATKKDRAKPPRDLQKRKLGKHGRKSCGAFQERCAHVERERMRREQEAAEAEKRKAECCQLEELSDDALEAQLYAPPEPEPEPEPDPPELDLLRAKFPHADEELIRKRAQPLIERRRAREAEERRQQEQAAQELAKAAAERKAKPEPRRQKK